MRPAAQALQDLMGFMRAAVSLLAPPQAHGSRAQPLRRVLPWPARGPVDLATRWARGGRPRGAGRWWWTTRSEPLTRCDLRHVDLALGLVMFARWAAGQASEGELQGQFGAGRAAGAPARSTSS